MSLDQAFDALKTYDWGMDPNVLSPIDDAAITTRGADAPRKELENRLSAVLKSGALRDAKDYVCRKLMIVGTSASVPALAELLADKELAHMARFALERIPGPEAAGAMREALPKLSGPLKMGVISSLGVRRDTASVAAIAALLADGDAAVVRSAAAALGAIRTPEASKALATAKAAAPQSPQAVAVTDASLACAERLLADGKRAEALAIYKSLAGEDQPKHVRLASTRGMVASTGKKE